MFDNELINLVASRLEDASAAAGWNYIVIQKDQPTQQGIPSAPTIYFEVLPDNQYGYPIVKNEYRSSTGDFSETETQIVQSTFQISALVPQNPNNLSLPTAKDVVGYMKRFIQSRITIGLWATQDVGMMRVTDVRNPYFVDDKDRFESNPNFDLVLSHSNDLINIIPAVSKIVGAPSTIPGDNTAGVFAVPDDAGELAG